MRMSVIYVFNSFEGKYPLFTIVFRKLLNTRNCSEKRTSMTGTRSDENIWIITKIFRFLPIVEFIMYYLNITKLNFLVLIL